MVEGHNKKNTNTVLVLVEDKHSGHHGRPCRLPWRWRWKLRLLTAAVFLSVARVTAANLTGVMTMKICHSLLFSMQMKSRLWRVMGGENDAVKHWNNGAFALYNKANYSLCFLFICHRHVPSTAMKQFNTNFLLAFIK